MKYAKHDILEDDYIVIDIETTGLSPRDSEIIEFCGLKVHDGRIVDELNILIKPYRPISPFITSLTGITNSLVENSSCIDDVISSIHDFIKNDIVLGHNVCFDLSFISNALLILREIEIDNKYIDLLRISRRMLKDSVNNHKLETIAHHLNKDYFPSHRAKNDCLATYEAYETLKNIAKKHNINQITMLKGMF